MKTLIVAATLALGLISAASAGARAADPVSVTIDPTAATVVLGDSLDLTVTVSNDGTAATTASVVHLDVTDPSKSKSVDPEDWTSTLTRPIGPLDPGATITVEWSIQPISPGTFIVYAVVLSDHDDTVAASNVLRVTVHDKRSLNPGGILPIALGAPTLIGGLLAWQTIRTRRRR